MNFNRILVVKLLFVSINVFAGAKTLYKQPTDLAGPSSILYTDADRGVDYINGTVDQTLLNAWLAAIEGHSRIGFWKVPGYAADLARNQTWNAGSYTGISVPSPYSSYQRGVSNINRGSHTIQAYNGQVGMINNPASIPNSWRETSNRNTGIYFGTRFAPGTKPWNTTGAKLKISFDLKMPYTTGTNNSTFFPYTNIGVSLRDTRSRKEIWYLIQSSDARGFVGHGGTQSIDGLNVAQDCPDGSCSKGIVGGAFFPESTYITFDSSVSSTAQASSWSSYQHFEAKITEANLKKAVDDLAAIRGLVLSRDPKDYELIDFVFANEIGILNSSSTPAGFQVTTLRGMLLQVLSP